MKKEQFIKIAIGGAIVVGLVYLIFKPKKTTKKETLKINDNDVEEEVSGASGVQNVGYGWFVKCADGSQSSAFGSYNEALSNVDTLCANRGGGGIVLPVSNKGAKFSATR